MFEELYLPGINSKPIPIISKVVKSNGQWILQPYAHKFKLPDKLYGNVKKIADRILKTYMDKQESIGAMFLGPKGTGKTELAKYLANLAIDNGYPVVLIENIQPDVQLIDILDNMRDVVIFIDEFGKIFNQRIQDKMLTMFSDLKSTHKLFIITENHTYVLSEFLLDRPGRFRYNITLKKVPRDVVIEYCKDKGVKEKFIKDMLSRYDNTKDFTFDYLHSIIDEHLRYPDMEFDELIEIMNVTSIKLKEAWKVNKLWTVIDGKELLLPVAKDLFKPSELYGEITVYLDINKIKHMYEDNPDFINNITRDLLGPIFIFKAIPKQLEDKKMVLKDKTGKVFMELERIYIDPYEYESIS